MKTKKYKTELKKLQAELVQLQRWVQRTGQKVVIVLEGRDAAGKGGVIKKLVQRLNPNHYRVVAKGKPTADEEEQWYFQRWVKEMPRSGELVIFDRSWYTRAGVESVMGFASKQEVSDFLKDAPSFERMLSRQGIVILKYWLSIDQATQEDRFHARLNDITKQWKLSPMDLESRTRWDEYTKAKERMFKKTHTKHCPWFVVDANDKQRTAITLFTHLLGQFQYEREELAPKQLPPVYVHPRVSSEFDTLRVG